MQPTHSAVFLIQLLQDVHILRPLVFMARRDFGFDTLVLVPAAFRARDSLGIWGRELEEICRQAGARLEFFDDHWDAYRHLNGQGLLFAASESNVENHATAHKLFSYAPASYLKVTLQHGFDCVGFRHAADHIRAHGETASFAADLLCTWFGSEKLTSMAASQLAKVVVTGPTSVLQMAAAPIEREPNAPGIVCENLHSVRFNVPGNLKFEFLNAFNEFARIVGSSGREVRLRPHPGGQYLASSKATIPSNVQLENAPLYRLDLRRYSYGVSTPSSVLVDMLLAQIPTAVWRDSSGLIDIGSYEGLTTVSTAREWVDFSEAAERDPTWFVSRQNEFLDSQAIPLEPQDVFSRFAQLFETVERIEVRSPGSVAERERLLLVTMENAAGIEQTFVEPLAGLIARGEITTRTVTGQQLAELAPSGEDRLVDFLNTYNPSSIILSGWASPLHRSMALWAKERQVPIIYVVHGTGTQSADEGWDASCSDASLGWTSELLSEADLVYASTETLKSRLEDHFPGLPVVAAKVPPEQGQQRDLRTFLREDILELLALGHATVARTEEHQVQREFRACDLQ